MRILKIHPDKKEKIFCKEYLPNSDTQKLCYSAVYKLDRISHEERLVNLCALLVGDEACLSAISLPTNSEVE